MLSAATRDVKGRPGGPRDRGRTHTSPTPKPRALELPPGQYRVLLKAVRLPGKPSRELAATVAAGSDTTLTVDFSR